LSTTPTNALAHKASQVSWLSSFFNNKLAAKAPATARAASARMSMPVSACSVERVNSKLGNTWVPNRNALGVQKAQDLGFVKCNDPMMQSVCSKDTMVV
jgi:hypothetical protein